MIVNELELNTAVLFPCRIFVVCAADPRCHSASIVTVLSSPVWGQIEMSFLSKTNMAQIGNG